MSNKVGFEGVEKGLELSAIGNCSYNALIDRRGCVVWCCFPRYDGDPVFCSLLRKNKDIGFFEIEVNKSESIKQEYIENTAILKTRITDNQGGCVEITDFAPRFKKYERIYRPNMLLRQIVPISGRPRIRIRLRPTFGYGWGVPEKTRGSNHIRYLLPTMTLRLTTNAPVSYIVDEVLFEIEETIHLFLMPDESLTEPMNDIAILHLKSTIEYWQDFTRTLTIPFDWQEQVIRSCIALKLCFFEETGAIIRAATTSIPCYPDDPERTNFDHRYCFLEDAYDITSTLREVGAVEVMQSYLRFISNIVACYGTEGAFDDEINWQGEEASGRLGPAYGIALESKLFEKEMHRLVGYRGMQPVRCGFKDFAANRLHIYGIVILTLTQLFYDNRLNVRGDITMFHRLETLAKYAIKQMEELTEITSSIAAATGEPTSQKPGPSIYSHAVLWGACDRLSKISLKLGLSERHKYWCECAVNGKRRVYEKGLHPITKDHFVATMGGNTVEPKLLQLPSLGFVEANDPIFLKTLEKIEEKYKKGKFIVVEDEWNGLHNTTPSGVPSVEIIPKPKKTTAILAPIITKSDGEILTRALSKKKNIARTIHTLWYIQALAKAGRDTEGREIFNYLLSAVNTCGLLSDSIDVYSGELWGNFPATVCMGGILRCASLLSRKWNNVL